MISLREKNPLCWIRVFVHILNDEAVLPSQPNVRSTRHCFGKTTNPFISSERLTISMVIRVSDTMASMTPPLYTPSTHTRFSVGYSRCDSWRTGTDPSRSCTDPAVVGFRLGRRALREAARSRRSLIEGADDAEGTAIDDVGVDHRGADVAVSEQGLDGTDVGASFEQMGGEAVAQGVEAAIDLFNECKSSLRHVVTSFSFHGWRRIRRAGNFISKHGFVPATSTNCVFTPIFRHARHTNAPPLKQASSSQIDESPMQWADLCVLRADDSAR